MNKVQFGSNRYNTVFILGIKSYDLTVMETIVSGQIRKENLEKSLEKNYTTVSTLWSGHQLEWINGVYQPYKDHDKYLIAIYLIKKTFDFYSKNFVKQSLNEYFEKDAIEIDTLNVMEVSKVLNIPKESARRKINELEKSGAIKRVNKTMIIDKAAFRIVKPEKSITRVSRFLSSLSITLCDEKVLAKEYDTSSIQVFIEKNFSFIWKLYYELQIPMVLSWKKIFGDIETFHVWAVCVVNQQLNSKREVNFKMNKKSYIKELLYDHNSKDRGVNAMSISDISGIPRATVIRKLKILMKKKYLKINDKKHYSITGIHQEQIILRHKINYSHLAEFTSRVFNFMIIEQSQKKFNKNDEKRPYYYPGNFKI